MRWHLSVQRSEWLDRCVALSSKIEFQERVERHNLSTTAKQAAMVWACAAKRRQRLGEEMYGV